MSARQSRRSGWRSAREPVLTQEERSQTRLRDMSAGSLFDRAAGGVDSEAVGWRQRRHRGPEAIGIREAAVVNSSEDSVAIGADEHESAAQADLVLRTSENGPLCRLDYG